MTFEKYELIDQDGHSDSSGYLYDNADEAIADAKKYGGYAVKMLTFEYSDSELVWTPNGNDVWPPESSDS